jgi:hypothetical protein
MITFVRTADIHDGKAPMAIEWALKVAAYINEKYGTNVSIQQNVGGKVNQLHWVDMYETMDESLALGAKLNMDEGFQQLMAEAGEQGLFAANSVVDNYYQSIP